eukprot:g1737.t1
MSRPPPPSTQRVDNTSSLPPPPPASSSFSSPMVSFERRGSAKRRMEQQLEQLRLQKKKEKSEKSTSRSANPIVTAAQLAQKILAEKNQVKRNTLMTITRKAAFVAASAAHAAGQSKVVSQTSVIDAKVRKARVEAEKLARREYMLKAIANASYVAAQAMHRSNEVASDAHRYVTIALAKESVAKAKKMEAEEVHLRKSELLTKIHKEKTIKIHDCPEPRASNVSLHTPSPKTFKPKNRESHRVEKHKEPKNIKFQASPPPNSEFKEYERSPIAKVRGQTNEEMQTMRNLHEFIQRQKVSKKVSLAAKIALLAAKDSDFAARRTIASIKIAKATLKLKLQEAVKTGSSKGGLTDFEQNGSTSNSKLQEEEKNDLSNDNFKEGENFSDIGDMLSNANTITDNLKDRINVLNDKYDDLFHAIHIGRNDYKNTSIDDGLTKLFNIRRLNIIRQGFFKWNNVMCDEDNEENESIDTILYQELRIKFLVLHAWRGTEWWRSRCKEMRRRSIRSRGKLFNPASLSARQRAAFAIKTLRQKGHLAHNQKGSCGAASEGPPPITSFLRETSQLGWFNELKRVENKKKMESEINELREILEQKEIENGLSEEKKEEKSKARKKELKMKKEVRKRLLYREKCEYEERKKQANSAGLSFSEMAIQYVAKASKAKTSEISSNFHNMAATFFKDANLYNDAAKHYSKAGLEQEKQNCDKEAAIFHEKAATCYEKIEKWSLAASSRTDASHRQETFSRKIQHIDRELACEFRKRAQQNRAKAKKNRQNTMAILDRTSNHSHIRVQLKKQKQEEEEWLNDLTMIMQAHVRGFLERKKRNISSNNNKTKNG